MKNISLFLLGFVLLLISCDKEEDPVTDGCGSTQYTYTKDIKPIFDSGCAISGCHDAATKSDGVDLSSYQAVKAGDMTKLLNAITHTGPKPMPYNLPKLPEAQIEKIKCWVSQGTIE